MSDGQPDADDLEMEVEPRPAAAVARRLIVVSALCQRAVLETASDDIEMSEPEGDLFDLTAWLKSEGVWSEATGDERRLFETAIGQLSAPEVDRASWLSEAAVILGWCLHLVAAVPSYGEPTDPTDLLAAVPSPWDGSGAFVRQARLREIEALAIERERAELWYWRAAVASEMDAADPDGRGELVAAVAAVTTEAQAARLLPGTGTRDFPVGDRLYHELAEDEVDLLATIAAERFRAICWVCGAGAGWDDVPLAL